MGFFSKWFFYSIVIAMGSFSMGQSLSYYSPAKDEMDQIFCLSETASHWFNVMVPIAAIFGGPLLKPLIAKIGRKLSCFVLGIAIIITWILMAVSNKNVVALLFVARGIQGFVIGGVSGLCSMYIVEISPIEYRGAYGTIHQIFVTIGGLYQFAIGIIGNWRIFTWLSIIVSVLHVILIWFVPDSQVKELDETGSSESIFQKKYIKPLLHSAALVLAQQLAGINAVYTNLTTIFEDANVDLSAGVCSLIAQSAQTIAGLCCSYICEKIGRKKTFLISAIGMVVSLLILWANYLWRFWNMLPLILLFLYLLSFGIGFGPVPWLMVPELFPDSVRGMGQSLATGLNWASASLIVFIWPYMNAGIGAGWSFFAFAIIGILAILYGFFLMPETKGLLLGEAANGYGKIEELQDC